MKEHKGLPIEISEQILTIGPVYKNHRGGVGAVIEIYSRYFEDFKFIASHKECSNIRKVFFFFVNFMMLFFKLVFDRKIKIVHMHGASRGSFYRKFLIFLTAKYLFRKKVIYHIHGGKYHLFYAESNFLAKKMIRFLINQCDAVICLSNKWKDFFELQFSPQRIEIVPNIIDYPVEINRPKNVGNTTFLFLGFISENKGIFDLLQVVATNKEKYKNKIQIRIGGNGEVKRLTDFIKEHRLENLVEFLGWITAEDKESELNNCDIYILPSYNEGLPISILEAMSYKKAIISTPVGGIPEIVKIHENGLLVEPGNLKELETAINFCVDHPIKIKEYGIASEKLVQKHLPDSVCEKLVSLYQKVLADE